MITAEYVRALASYNRWQNGNLYGAADTLSDVQRKEQRGAFFGSIHGTLNHLLWADQIWMSRFAGAPKPKVPGIPDSPAMFDAWDDLKRERRTLDEVIADWAGKVEPAWLKGDLAWFSGAAGARGHQAE
ncbi:MAG: damage-inducible protein DinB, partial [Rhodospirillales bacterium]|nr:damage-inducible protein DinB [Rhodospirillales bacterium]